MSDFEQGKKALEMFYNYSKDYPNFPASFSDFAALYGKKFEIYCDGLGLAINTNNLSNTQVSIAMKNLSDQARGKIPKDHNSYFAAIQGQAGKISYLDLTKTVVSDVVETTLDGAQSLGNNLIGILKIANFALPFVAVYFGYLFLKKHAKGLKK